ncbi:bifunctional hydroxymethylpyrimidine kinase/phosphomethylpyrimidine kinase, partial [Arthrobacter deserti]|nr:bifunctional hydroxymethylpyrimidine kinase/phosphomethylpyrimidine kinase [Arthrobacter deserti]
PDALVDAAAGPGHGVLELSAPRVDTENTHGTGCSLSAALATVQARTLDWPETLRQVKSWLTGALERSGELGVGRGHGPIHHFHHLQPAGAPAFSEQLWQGTAAVREAIMELPFIRGLSAGTLAEEHFGYYLAQDARYLNGYSRVLARASALAPTEAEQLFWAKGAHQCLEVEAELHRSWLAGRRVPGELGPVTKQYVDHLQAIAGTGSYGELVAAVVPCYWLYAHVGEQLTSRHGAAGDHPYGAWLRTYADEGFAEATRQAVAIMDRAAAAETAAGRLRMRAAFEQSCRYELDFFDAARVHASPRSVGT